MSNQATDMTNKEGFPKLLLRGLDSLYAAYFVDTATCLIDWDDLEHKRLAAQESRRREFAEVELGSETFALLPYGMKPYRYVLRNRHFHIRLSERMHPACFVQFYSEGLWQVGLEGLKSRITRWLISLRLAVLQPESVSRADWAFDYHLPNVDFEIDDFVTRATKDATWREHRCLQSAQFGQGDVVVRVYDKVAEIDQQSDKAWFFDLWRRKDEIWRVEFQLRKSRLKQAGIYTLDNLKDFQIDVLRELATGHTTLRQPSEDSNRSRWPLHLLWKQLIRDIQSLPQTGLVQDIDPRIPLDWRLYRQGKSLYGSLKGISAVLTLIECNDNDPMSFEEVLDRLPELLRAYHRSYEWNHEIDRRVSGYRYGKW